MEKFDPAAFYAEKYGEFYAPYSYCRGPEHPLPPSDVSAWEYFPDFLGNVVASEDLEDGKALALLKYFRKECALAWPLPEISVYIGGEDCAGSDFAYEMLNAGKAQTALWCVEQGASSADAVSWAGESLANCAVWACPENYFRLLELGADPSLSCSSGYSVWHKLAMVDWGPDHRKIAASALNLGLDLDALSESGATPLHLAAKNSNMEAVRFLVAAGADPCVKGSMNALPADWARDAGIKEFLEGQAASRREKGDLAQSLAEENEEFAKLGRAFAQAMAAGRVAVDGKAVSTARAALKALERPAKKMKL